MKKGFLLFISLMVSFVAVAAFAEEPKITCTSKAQVRLATGNPKQTWSQMIQVAGGVRPDLVCEDRNSTGAIDNFGLLMSRKVDGAIASVDVADALKGSDPRIEKNVRSLMTLHGNSLHIFVLKDGTPTTVIKKSFGFNKKVVENVAIRNMRDLTSRSVAILGGALITMNNANDALKLGINFVEVKKPEDGFAKLDKNEVHAFIAIGGWPIPWAESVDYRKYSLAFVDPNDVKAIGQNYYYSGKITYGSIIGLPTLFVRNELFVWNYPNGERAEKLIEFRNFLKANIDNFANDVGSLPAWGDIDKSGKTYWPRYAPKVATKAKKK